ncbi:MAG: NAD(P)/FAD-dependent oxidoreductase [Deltaproteobacteria bacterium]|nr:NAD(P)/FAD-dependent oxidoreductase [Deltaproteobacteria bacterium]
MSRIVIIGAGIVGSSLAALLSENKKHEVHVIEKNQKIAEGVTSRNSGVIHSGLYYAQDSLKAQLCIEGQKLLYEWCEKYKVPHQKTGKLIIACEQVEEERLYQIRENALRSGVDKDNLAFLEGPKIQKNYPFLKAKYALFVKESGIVDPHKYCYSFYSKALSNETDFHFLCKVQEIEKKNHYTVKTNRGELECDFILNAAGLYADEIAQLVGIHKYKIYPWRGDYFKINLPYKVDKLVYPAIKKNAQGLGVHLTLDLQGSTFLGPDVEFSSSKDDFRAREDKKEIFFLGASRMFEDIKPTMLSYETCGIRPKLRSPTDTEEKDFVISEDIPGFINLVGLESPGLTAAIAIARFVKQKYFHLL